MRNCEETVGFELPHVAHVAQARLVNATDRSDDSAEALAMRAAIPPNIGRPLGVLAAAPTRDEIVLRRRVAASMAARVLKRLQLGWRRLGLTSNLRKPSSGNDVVRDVPAVFSQIVPGVDSKPPPPPAGGPTGGVHLHCPLLLLDKMLPMSFTICVLLRLPPLLLWIQSIPLAVRPLLPVLMSFYQIRICLPSLWPWLVQSNLGVGPRAWLALSRSVAPFT